MFVTAAIWLTLQLSRLTVQSKEHRRKNNGKTPADLDSFFRINSEQTKNRLGNLPLVVTTRRLYRNMVCRRGNPGDHGEVVSSGGCVSVREHYNSLKEQITQTQTINDRDKACRSEGAKAVPRSLFFFFFL
jgi:hypothetical protein